MRKSIYLQKKSSFSEKKSPEIGLATVYRTLEILTELKIVDKVSFNDGLARYDLRKKAPNISIIIYYA